MARNHAVDCHRCVMRFSPAGLRGPSVRSRNVSTQIETGLTLDQLWSQLGKVSAGTKAELANTKGKIRVKLAVCTKIPGIRKSTYGSPGGRASFMAPPKT